jgi:hypothetical protein
MRFWTFYCSDDRLGSIRLMTLDDFAALAFSAFNLWLMNVGWNWRQPAELTPTRSHPMTQHNQPPRRSSTVEVETGPDSERIPARPHDSGSQANETVDGLDATSESLRHAAEDTPSGARLEDVEKTPVFDRAGAAPKI